MGAVPSLKPRLPAMALCVILSRHFYRESIAKPGQDFSSLWNFGERKWASLPNKLKKINLDLAAIKMGELKAKLGWDGDTNTEDLFLSAAWTLSHLSVGAGKREKGCVPSSRGHLWHALTFSQQMSKTLAEELTLHSFNILKNYLFNQLHGEGRT